MIFIDNHEITHIVADKKVISYVYSGSRLVWQAIRSCFGSGVWISKKPWLSNEAWKERKKY